MSRSLWLEANNNKFDFCWAGKTAPQPTASKHTHSLCKSTALLVTYEVNKTITGLHNGFQRLRKRQSASGLFFSIDRYDCCAKSQ